MNRLKYVVIGLLLIISLTGCGSNENEEYTNQENMKTELLTLYYPDGSREEITFEWCVKTLEAPRTGTQMLYYDSKGQILCSKAICIAGSSTVYYYTPDSSERKVFSGTFTLETVTNQN